MPVGERCRRAVCGRTACTVRCGGGRQPQPVGPARAVRPRKPPADPTMIIMTSYLQIDGFSCADPAGFLMPAGRWQTDRHELAITLGRTLNAEQRLAELQADQQQALRVLQDAVDAG